MLFGLSTLVLALPVLASAFGISHRTNRLDSHVGKRLHKANNLVGRASGKFTFYYPGLGACGGTNGNNDFIVAMSVQAWDGGAHCGEQISITVNGITGTATIVDMCMGCGYNELDFSPGLFSYFGGNPGPGGGVLHGTWVSGADKAAEEEAARKKKEEEEEAARKKKEEEERKKKEEEEAAASASAAAASSSSAAEAARTSTTTTSTPTTTTTTSATTSSTSSTSSTSTAAPTPSDFIGISNSLLLGMSKMAVLGYQA